MFRPSSARPGPSPSSLPGFRVEISVAKRSGKVRDDLVVHRRSTLTPADVTRRDGIPVTTPACTLIDIATTVSSARLEAGSTRPTSSG
jgi:hypothetical protein